MPLAIIAISILKPWEDESCQKLNGRVQPTLSMRRLICLAGSIGILCLIFPSASVLAETSQPTAVGSEQVVTAAEAIPELLTATLKTKSPR